MLYLNEQAVESLLPDWREGVAMVERTLRLVASGRCQQPLKPYLAFPERRARVIAMPAALGGAAGLKWIASYPENLERGLTRAQSLTILNHPETGAPETLLAGSGISAWRTASVTAWLLDKWVRVRPKAGRLRFAVLGLGPVGLRHLDMVRDLFPHDFEQLAAYDPREEAPIPDGVVRMHAWEDIYHAADVVITCTNRGSPWIPAEPKNAGLVANISLRDFEPQLGRGACVHLVDSWTEVNREGTSVSLMVRAGLPVEKVVEMTALLDSQRAEALLSPAPVWFHPMGMAVFDVASATLVAEKARSMGLGQELL